PSGGALQNSYDNTFCGNCIFWGDTGGEIVWAGDVIGATYCDVQGGYFGTGNINIDPMFLYPLGPDGIAGPADDDLRMHSGSHCIDAADNTLVSAGVTTDCDGRARFV